MRYDICGLGNALMDVLVRLESEGLLYQHGLKKGQMHLVDESKWQQIYAALGDLPRETNPGGSCANVISTAALLGARSTFCGQVGQDQFGQIYSKTLAALCGDQFLHFLPGSPTGKCISLITPDAERTMATTLGCAIELEPEHVFYDVLAASRFFHLTGYLFTGGRMGAAAQAALDYAKARGVKISFDVADSWVVETLHARIWELIDQYADVVFTNADEATALCGCAPEEAVVELARHCEIAIVKLGGRGSLIRSGEFTAAVDVFPVEARDTTGAGDSYAGGFLYALSRGYDLARCGRVASRVAAEAVTQTGAVVSRPGRLREVVQEV